MGQSDSSRGEQAGRSSRCIALIGPYLSGKTTLLESILARTGAVTRQGTIADKSTVGDASPEVTAARYAALGCRERLEAGYVPQNVQRGEERDR